MTEKRILKENGVDILPITHETAVLTSEGTTIDQKYATKEEVSSQVSEINARVDVIDTKVGELSSLNTSDKTSVVNAINELFQFGNETKQKLVDTLIAKKIDASTSETFESLLNKFKDIEFGTGLPYAAEHTAYGYLTTLSQARVEHSSAAVGDNVYILGGKNDSSTFQNINLCYNIKDNSITAKTSIPQVRVGHTSTTLDGKIYVVGGMNATTLQTTNYCYDPTTDSWSTKTAITNGYYGSTSGTVNGKLYVIGGAGSSSTSATAYKTNYCYDPLTDSWTIMATCTAVRKYAKSVVVGSNIHVLGGMNASTSQKTHYIYNTETNTWSTGTALTQAVHNFSIGYMNGKIYVICGVYISSSSTTYRTNTYYYDFDSSAWTQLTSQSIITSYNGASSSVVDDKLYLFGGYSAATAIQYSYVFTPLGGE